MFFKCLLSAWRKNKKKKRSYPMLCLLACRCHQALMIEMLERWVHLHLPSRQSRKRKKRPIINHFSSSPTTSLHHPIMPASYKQHANRRLINTSCIRSHPSTIFRLLYRIRKIDLSFSSSSSFLALVYSWLMDRSVWSKTTNHEKTVEKEKEREIERKKRKMSFFLYS